MLQTDNGYLGKTQTFHIAQPAAPLPHGKQPSGASEQLESQQLNWAQHEDPWLVLDCRSVAGTENLLPPMVSPLTGFVLASPKPYIVFAMGKAPSNFI